MNIRRTTAIARAAWASGTVAICVALLASCAPSAPPAGTPSPTVSAAPLTAASATALIGTWKVDLRPLPTSPEYYEQLVVTAVNGKEFTGTFYGSPVTEARINVDWGAVRIAFVSSDGSGPYHHSAVLVGDTLEGLSNSTGRDFLSYWSAVKLP